MPRLNIERQKELEPKRMDAAILALDKLGITPILTTSTRIEFEYKGSSVFYYPYSGWHTGKTIKNGRGLQNLLKQINQQT